MGAAEQPDPGHVARAAQDERLDVVELEERPLLATVAVLVDEAALVAVARRDLALDRARDVAAPLLGAERNRPD